MEKITDKKQVNKVALLFALTYMVSYITRFNYGVIISEMEETTGLSRSILSIALTGSSVTYGFGQLVSGFCGDRFSPKKLVSMGLFVTTIMNIMLPLCENPMYMFIVWCINGFAQSFMWPPFVRLLTELLTDDDYKNTVTKISWGSSCGTILLYLISPFIIAFASWKAVFMISAFSSIIMLYFWNKLSYEINVRKNIVNEEKEIKAKNSINLKILLSPLMVALAFAIIFQGILKDGITTWMPTYISEIYNMNNIISILAGVFLPMFNMAAVHLATKLYVKKITNPFLCAGVFFIGAIISTVIMYIFSGYQAIVSILSSALITGCMYGANLMFTCMIPPFFKTKGNVSTVSGLLNCLSYIGTAVSTYGVAVLSEAYGWNFTIFIWITAAVLGTVICFVSFKPWNKFIK